MAADGNWVPVEADLETILARYPRPLDELAEGRVPTFVMRRAFDPAHAAALVQRFYERGLLYDPRTREGVGRVDIGTSMGHRGKDPDEFFAHARQTHDLFATLFEGYDNPVEFIYATLSALAPGKRVMVAREKDGRLYGPAIFRTYYEDRGHGPHADTLLRDRLQETTRSRYEIAGFERQLSGVLCFQKSETSGESGQAFLYRRCWTPDLAGDWSKTFRQDAEAQGIERVRIELEPGDFYVFCSEYVHEVPFVSGETPRIVLAAFFAMSADDEEIFVWS